MTQSEYSIWFVGDEFATALHLPLSGIQVGNKAATVQSYYWIVSPAYEARDHWSSWPQKILLDKKAWIWNDIEWNGMEQSGTGRTARMLAFLVFHL